MKRNEKEQLVDSLHEEFSRAKIVIVTDYKGLNVTRINELRAKLKEAGVAYRVVKNTLLILAAEDTDVAALKENFQGPSAIAMSFDDPVAPAKVLTAFAKENEKLEIKAGVMGSQALSFEQIKALADLPSREVLLSKMLSALNGVPTGFVRTLSAIPGQFLNVLQAVRDQKEAA